MHFLLGESQFTRAHVLHGPEFYLLEPDDPGIHLDFAVIFDCLAGGSGIKFLQDLDLCIGNRVREIFRVHPVDIGLAVVVVEPFHVVLMAVLEVDGFLVDGRKRAREVHFADDPRRVRGIHDHKIIGRDRAKADGVRRIAFGNPVPPVACAVQETDFRQVLAQALEVEPAELLVLAQGKLEGGALQMVEQDVKVVGVDVTVFG